MSQGYDDHSGHDFFFSDGLQWHCECSAGKARQPGLPWSGHDRLIGSVDACRLDGLVISCIRRARLQWLLLTGLDKPGPQPQAHASDKVADNQIRPHIVINTLGSCGWKEDRANA